MNSSGFIVLFNPISNEGHLDSWHAMFTHVLVNEGWNVLAASHDPESVRNKIIHRGLLPSEQWQVIGLSHSKNDLRSFVRKLWSRWNTYALSKSYARTSMFNQGILYLQKVMLSTRGKKNIQNNMLPSAFTHLDPTEFRNQINSIIDAYPEKILGIFNMYLDAYLPDPVSWMNFAFKQNLPWMGLCITPETKQSQGYYSLEQYQGTCFLDENVCIHYSEHLPEKHFAYLPDITETALLSIQTDLAKEIRACAKKRKIVFMGGSVGKQKNIARWLDLISKADPEKWFFVQVGRVNVNNLTPEDEAALEKVANHPIENLLIKPVYLKDEREFNNIIAISDVIYAVYRDFSRSSNMLSKAAYFEKPILVSDFGLMGSRVRQYGIGIAVNQDNTESMLKGLNSLEHIQNINERFKAYRDAFSETVMQSTLSNFIHSCLGK